MEFEVHASSALSERAAFWREKTESVFTERGFTPYVSKVFLAESPRTLAGYEEFGANMESVALAIPKIEPQVPMLLDLIESDRLLQGEEGQKIAIADAIVREEGFHARDYAIISQLPRERWADHVNENGYMTNTYGLHSMLEVRVLDDHVSRVPGLEEWFLVHYKVPWAKHVWHGLRQRMLIFRKRHTDLAWVEGNAAILQELFFRFSETFVCLLRHLPKNPDVQSITSFAEWDRIKEFVAAFDQIYEDGFRNLPADGTALSGFSLTARMQEEVLTPWLQRLVS